MRILQKLVSGAVVVILCCGFVQCAWGFGSNIAKYVYISDTKAAGGDIIVLTSKGLQRARNPYDEKVRGVIVENPEIYIKTTENALASDSSQLWRPILDSGEVYVKVTSANGSITAGDGIATSTTPGVGVRATRGGYIVGRALESYKNNNEKAVGTIRIAYEPTYMDIKPNPLSYLFDALNISLAAGNERPFTFFKYLMAGVVAIMSVGFGFLYFGRIAMKGVEALGRNPLASKTIQAGIMLNVFLSILVAAGGVLVAIFILRL
jgi:hypothetical protein